LTIPYGIVCFYEREEPPATGRVEMARTTRDHWIEEGFRILSEEGDGALTVDALCGRLDRSKGSFYHHFGGREAFVESLLGTWERRVTDRLIATGQGEEPVEDRLRALNREASELRIARLERAIRGWAAREPLARRVQDRVDRRRLAFLEELCAERMGSGEAATRLARVLQLTFVGAQHLDPPLEGEELYRTFRFLEPLFGMGGGA
jgi:AcrR family transcriptional regulator